MEKITTDVLVIGSGGAGLTAALVAAKQGLKVLLVEKTDKFGGTTAWSGGGIWVPCNSLAKAAGVDDSPQKSSHLFAAKYRPDRAFRPGGCLCAKCPENV